MSSPARSEIEQKKLKYALLLLILAVAAGIRTWNFPGPYELRDGDELGHVADGLLLLEGMSPSFKSAPSGPLIWLSWAYGIALSTKHFLFPEEEDRSRPLMLRPFLAIDRTLFDTYQDMSTLKQILVFAVTLISLAATWAAFEYGSYHAGLAGALMGGGLVASLPLFVSFSGMARPYAMGWSFGVIALYFAATHSRPRRLTWAALFMGLAVATRIDMLLLLPLIFWELWYRREESPGFAHSAFKLCGIALLTLLLVSPWFLTTFVGNLRTLVMIRFFPFHTAPWHKTLWEVLWDQGLWPAIALLVIGLALSPPASRRTHWTLLVLLILLGLTMLKSTHGGLRHQGAVITAFVSATPLALHGIQRFLPRGVYLLAAVVLLLPAFHGVANVIEERRTYVRDEAATWIEQHVAPGARIYLSPHVRVPLPTEAAADALWSQVTDGAAWRTKFAKSLNRFGLANLPIPRALSEDNLVQDRNLRRRWFLLGGGPESAGPRFDIQVYGAPLFDLTPQQALDQFKAQGGVLVWRGGPPPGLDRPTASWTNAQGRGVFVYCSPDVLKDSIKDQN